MARRLVQLASVCTINVDPAIFALAETGLLTDADFKPFPKLQTSERAAVQKLIDYDFRAVFPAQGMTGGMVTLAAAKIANIEPIFVHTKRGKFWQNFAEEMKVSLEIIQLERRRFPDADQIRDKRHGLLIVDEMMNSVEAQVLAMDFQKTVVLTNRRIITDLTDVIQTISPNAPTEILTNINAYFRRDLEIAGFKTTRAEDLAFLCGVVTDLMAITNEPQPESVDIDPELYAKLERNVKLGHLRLG